MENLQLNLKIINLKIIIKIQKVLNLEKILWNSFLEWILKKHVFPHLDKYTYNSIIPEKIQSQISNELVLEKRYRLEFLKKKHGGKLIFAIMTACLITITIPKWLLIRYRDKERKKFKFEERLKEEEVYETLPNVKRTREEQEKWYQKNNEEE